MDRSRRSCPVVLINGPSSSEPLPAGNYCSIPVSEQRVGTLATQHLLNEGRGRIAFLGVQGASRWSTQQRLAGYQAALLANGIQPREEWLRYAQHATIREGFIATSTILSQLARPDSIFAVNDLLAVGALLACRDAGLRVPEDIAVVGVDDTEIAIVAQPPLTSIRLHQRAIGQQAVNLVLSMLRPGTPGPLPAPELPTPDLIVRRSSTLRVAPATLHEEIDALE
jgi:DNA-binding LacI/PurR family transcriptional regulator